MSFPATNVIYFWIDRNLSICVHFTVDFHHNKQGNHNGKLNLNTGRIAFVLQLYTGGPRSDFFCKIFSKWEKGCVSLPVWWEEDVWWLSVFFWGGFLIAERQGVTTVRALTHYQRRLISRIREREACSPAKPNTMIAESFFLLTDVRLEL